MEIKGMISKISQRPMLFIATFFIFIILLILGILVIVRNASVTSHPASITPTITVASGSAIAVTQNQLITVDQARTYAIKNPFPQGQTVSGKAPTIVSVIATTAGGLTNLLPNGEATGLAANEPVIYIKEQGPFTLSNTHYPFGTKAPTFTYGIRVIDAKNGNVVMETTSN